MFNLIHSRKHYGVLCLVFWKEVRYRVYSYVIRKLLITHLLYMATQMNLDAVIRFSEKKKVSRVSQTEYSQHQVIKWLYEMLKSIEKLIRIVIQHNYLVCGETLRLTKGRNRIRRDKVNLQYDNSRFQVMKIFLKREMHLLLVVFFDLSDIQLFLVTSRMIIK